MKLLYKEFMLAAHPSLIIFTLLGCLVIVPAYPYSVIFMFGCLAPFITFMFARENAFNVPNNPVGMDATVGWYGFGLVIFAVFDLVFFPAYYKSGYKAGKSFLAAMIPVVLLMTVVEGIIYVPQLTWLDSTAPENLIRQLPILAFGILFYACGVFLAYHIAAKRFEKVDL